jgi:hypothetical protein
MPAEQPHEVREIKNACTLQFFKRILKAAHPGIAFYLLFSEN